MGERAAGARAGGDGIARLSLSVRPLLCGGAGARSLRLPCERTALRLRPCRRRFAAELARAGGRDRPGARGGDDRLLGGLRAERSAGRGRIAELARLWGRRGLYAIWRAARRRPRPDRKSTR